MKQLLLLRHAKSSWKCPALIDFERPLNKRGKQDAPEMAALICAKISKPDRIYCSPAQRTISTLKPFKRIWKLSKSDIQYAPSIYEATPSALASLLQSTPDNYQRVMLIGHNPGLTLLANYLDEASPDNMVTSSICLFSSNCVHWDDLLSAKWQLEWYLTPRQILDRYGNN